MTDPADRVDAHGSVADLAATVLEEEARRQGDQRGRDPVVLPDDLLPGVGREAISTRQALKTGGVALVATLGVSRIVSSIDLAAVGVLAPDIQQSLGVSDSMMGAIGGAFGLLYLAGAVPVSALADRRPRRLVAGTAMAIWAVIAFTTGLVQSTFWLFWSRVGVWTVNGYSLPVNAPMLADGYPIEARTRVFGIYGGMELVGRAAGPLIAGGVAGVIAGPDSWRWFFFIVGLAGVPVAIATFCLREPRRGGNEMREVLGTELEADPGELPVSTAVAFQRLLRIRTFAYFLVGMAALGFALFSVPLCINLLLRDQFGLDAWERGMFGSLTALPGLVALVIAAPRADALLRRSPPSAMVFVGALVASFGIVFCVSVWMPNVWLLGVLFAIAIALAQAAYICTIALVNAVIPHELRSRGTAIIGVYLMSLGAFLGALQVAEDLFGLRGSLVAIVLPGAVIGGALIARGARFVREDMSLCVEELLEAKAEADRVAEPEAEARAIQVRNLDFSYGAVPILFDINLDVRRGETVALLGTNGAGKSTLLRVISGLGVPTRGAVRLHGRTITYTDPEVRAKIGIVQLMGGNAVFGPLTIDENLRMAAYLYEGDEAKRRVDAVLTQFPLLRERPKLEARDLSGGQQQMLALAMALVHEPEVLIIDELSLGLAPVVVQEILEIVRALKERGLTMIIVEQSLNVALSIADRAVFMEKGQIRFDGPTAELAQRDDLVRAVFLGADA